MRVSLFILPALVGILLAGCHGALRNDLSTRAETLQRFDFRSAHMGTLFHMSLYATNQDWAERAADAAFRRIAGLEEVMSDYQADSELNRLCQQPSGTPVRLSEDLFDVLSRAQNLSKMSDGAFDVTVGPYVRLWRFARKRKVLPDPAELARARAAVGWEKLRLDPKRRTATLQVPEMRLDLGGIAKGYSADEALKVLRGYGIGRAFVAASGDIAVGEPPPGETGWRVAVTGLSSTSDTNALPPVLLLRNAAVSTSGDTEQFIEIGGIRFSHIISPFTGLGLTNRIQATIVAPNATLTDALATTVCVQGPVRGIRTARKNRGVEVYVVTAGPEGRRSFQTRGFDRLRAGPNSSPHASH